MRVYGCLRLIGASGVSGWFGFRVLGQSACLKDLNPKTLDPKVPPNGNALGAEPPLPQQVTLEPPRAGSDIFSKTKTPFSSFRAWEFPVSQIAWAGDVSPKRRACKSPSVSKAHPPEDV